MRNGSTKSCGCLSNELLKKRNSIHGLCRTRIYSIWDNMIQRCTNPNRNEFVNYGGRGIKICDEWRQSFRAFYEWAIDNGYDDNLSLDRIDVDGNYCPQNCRWITVAEQGANKRNCVLIEINGKTQTMSQWARECGVSSSTIYRRFKAGANGLELIKKGRNHG